VTTPHTIADAATALRTGRLTSVDLVESALASIAAHNAATNAFIFVDAEGARAQARAADASRHSGMELGPLHGLPISLKDLIDVAGQPTTAASKVLNGHMATADATVVTRLRAAGAVLVGKTNLHEFAVGPTSEDSAYGPVRHPRDARHVAGGSSGGSAVAVATGMSLASIGSDTGGSIRIPAACCGVVGLKPSLGEVPTDGVIPLSTTLDHVGPITRTVADARLVWQVLADRHDAIQSRRAPGALSFAVLDGLFTDRISPEVAAAFAHAVAQLARAGASIRHVSLADVESIPGAYGTIVLPEGAAWHARFLDDRPGDYTPIVRSRLEAGRSMLAVDYVQAMIRREELRRAVDGLLDGIDALILPTLPVVAPLIGQNEVEINDGARVPTRPALLRNTQPFNLTGHPAITLPLATDGWPIGIQLVGHRHATSHLLDVAAAAETVVCG
jgi:aspartyl-tRNA(Asn)/glutamyl-tRNA(Gln) amidotransferase subunit A